MCDNGEEPAFSEANTDPTEAGLEDNRTQLSRRKRQTFDVPDRTNVDLEGQAVEPFE